MPTTTHTTAAPRADGSWLDRWEPEDAGFWAQEGGRLAQALVNARRPAA